MKSALLYVRVSTERQGEEGFSLDAQEKQGLAYAHKSGLEVVRIWKGSESAWKKDRMAFNQMIDYAKKHSEVEHIIFDILDRMTRNDFDKLKIVDLVSNYGKTIHFARSNKIYSKNSSPDDEFMFDIEVAVAKKMSNDISRKTRMGMNEKAEQGILPSHAPMGYKNNPLTKTVDVDPVNAPFIQSLFQKVATGSYSLAMLEDLMYAAGLRHPLKGSRVRKSTLHRIITSPMYYGMFIWGGKPYKGNHTPLISKELWEEANGALKRFHRPYKTKRNFAFGSLLVCGTCDCTIVGELQKEKYTYYRCSFSKGQHEHEGYIREADLAERFDPIVEEVTMPEEAADWLKAGLKVKLGQAAKLGDSKRKSLQNEHDLALAKLNRLYDIQLAGNMNPEIFKAKEKELNESLANAKIGLEACAKDPRQLMQEADDTLQLMTGLHTLYQKADNHEKANILKFLGQGYVLDGKEIKPDYRVPFNLLAEYKKSCPAYASDWATSSKRLIWGALLDKFYDYLVKPHIPLSVEVQQGLDTSS